MAHPRVILVKALKKVKLNRIASKIYYKYIHGFNSAGKELPEVIEKCFNKAIEFGTAAKGHYYEFGIYKGHTFAHACNFGQKNNLNNMRYFGFDSFHGLPEIKGLDKTKEENFYKGQYCAPKDRVIRDVTSAGVNWDNAFLIEGYFNQSLNIQTKEDHKMDKIAVALVDCDLHSSTVEVLDFMKDMIIDKTIIIFDDYDTYDANDDLGQRRAFKDFLKENKNITYEEWFTYGAYGHVFIINMKKRNHYTRTR
jgi:O-methyltransferase